MLRRMAAHGPSPTVVLTVLPAARRSIYGTRHGAASFPTAPWHNETPPSEIMSIEGSDAEQPDTVDLPANRPPGSIRTFVQVPSGGMMGILQTPNELVRGMQRASEMNADLSIHGMDW